MNEKKVREAIELIKQEIQTLEDLGEVVSIIEEKKKKHIELYNTAIKALEKQLPKKPNFSGDGYAPDGTFVYDMWECPCCGEEYEVDYDEYDYCPNCGQRLDWSE